MFNKTDLYGSSDVPTGSETTAIYLSAKTGAGIEQLRSHLKQVAGFTPTPEGAFMARRRHIDALQSVRQSGSSAAVHIADSGAGELAAEDLRMAQDQLNLITGEFGSDDLLGEIFGRFCIGK